MLMKGIIALKYFILFIKHFYIGRAHLQSLFFQNLMQISNKKGPTI